jgi:hypothetical protein
MNQGVVGHCHVNWARRAGHLGRLIGSNGGDAVSGPQCWIGGLQNAVNHAELPARAPLGHAKRARDCGEAVP